MRLVRHLFDLPYAELAEGSVVTIGSFDGLHLGHQALLGTVLSESRRLGLPAAVISFEPTPKEFFQAEHPPARLMRFREKFIGLAAYGVDIFYCPRFSDDMRAISAADFVRRLLVQGLNVRSLVVGDDFRFARRREGTVELLGSLGKALSFSVHQSPSITIDGLRVSSTAIRDALASGDIETATRLLGRPYRMSGRVVKGERVGRTLGFPTANVDLRRRQCALDGVFAVRVHGLGKLPVDGVASVGSRPTFEGNKPLLEVHLFDFDEDVYGRFIDVDFVARLRSQEKYDDIDGLVAQMHLDADNARKILRGDAA
jgi:riboflavin kinase/FMN adenylyltransferase